jgi:ABC-type nitrate/sulfonate/bicarbonate transport system substrate-binding protein
MIARTLRKSLCSAIRALFVAAVAALAGGCALVTPPRMEKVIFRLDWAPNTNHTGIYVAMDKGWYKEKGMEIELLPPSEVGREQVVANGQAHFGISFAEWVTSARAQGVPIVSIAAIIQRNSTGFASPAERGLTRPKDLEGHRYGGHGSPVEYAMLKALMACDGGDVDKIQFVDTGYADVFTATQRDADFTWIYYAWEGIEAELRGMEMNVIWLRDYVPCLPDYYTPVIITSEQLIRQNPDLVRRFMEATARGYEFAIANPSEAAEILIKYAEADPELIRRSQEWLSKHYAEDAPQWGYQDPAVWERFTSWMAENNLIAQPIDASKAFTNEFLPKK